jgi:hypothetical protein
MKKNKIKLEKSWKRRKLIEFFIHSKKYKFLKK